MWVYCVVHYDYRIESEVFCKNQVSFLAHRKVKRLIENLAVECFNYKRKSKVVKHLSETNLLQSLDPINLNNLPLYYSEH
jgi:hypothetical protein